MFSDCLPVCVCFHACMLVQSHSVTSLPLTCACLFLACTGCVSVAEWQWLWRRSRWRCTKTKAKTSSQLLSLAQELLSLMGKSSLMICHLSACLSFISNKAYIHCNMVHILVTDCCILATVIMIVMAAAATTAVWHYKSHTTSTVYNVSSSHCYVQDDQKNISLNQVFEDKWNRCSPFVRMQIVRRRTPILWF